MRYKETLIILILCSFLILTKCEKKDRDRDLKKNGNKADEDLQADRKKPIHILREDDNDLDVKNCWVNLKAKQHFETMNKIDDKYGKARQEFAKELFTKSIDKNMLNKMIKSRAAAKRAILNAGGAPSKIPAGINLGGYSMMRLASSILFFHRLKLRNETKFRVTFFENDFEQNMAVMSRVSLNDLHLLGFYERAITDKEPGTLFYRPTYGEVELLLKDVNYKMEGRYRFVQDRLYIEHIISEIRLKEVLMLYRVNGSTNCQVPEVLDPAATAEFIARLKADLDSWLKDYFNDYITTFGLEGAHVDNEIRNYDKDKAIALNDYVEDVIKMLKSRLYALDPPAANVKAPYFLIYSVTGVQIQLHDGVIRGFDSFYRHSMATGRREGKVRMVDVVLGFSRLKIEYKYTAIVDTKTPNLKGLIVLSANELIWRMGIKMIKDPESVDLSFEYIRQTSPQALVVEGPLNRYLASFKHLLEDQIITLLINTLYFHITMLGTLTRCEPSLIGYLDPGEEPKTGDSVERLSFKTKNYALFKNDSMEVEIPGQGDELPRKFHIKYGEQFNVTEQDLSPERLQAKGRQGKESGRRSRHHSKKKSKKSKKNKHKKKKKHSKKHH